MTTPADGNELLEVRTRWPHEDLDFTPWLAQNLDLLGAEIGMSLQLVQEEKPVGRLSLDILAKDAATGAPVAIENQLEWTDVDHLGRLLIYAAGCDAQTAIWVAPEFMYEHAKTLHWLNEWTRNTIKFYCVKVEVVAKAGESSGEPRFRKVVYPGNWDKGETLPPDPPLPPIVQKHHDFYRPLIAELLQTGFADRDLQHFGYTGRRFPSGRNRGVAFAVSLESRNNAWVTLHIRTDSNERTKHVFDELQKDREAIESSIDACAEWHWNRHDSYLFSSINVRRDGSISDSDHELGKTRTWMLDLLPKFKNNFDQRVEKILASYDG